MQLIKMIKIIIKIEEQVNKNDLIEYGIID
jgi:hypothetical protein